MKAIFLIFCLLFLPSSLSLAEMPTGFDPQFSKPAAPNSIAGLKKNAKENDYALLRGEFVERIDENTFIFQDEKHGQCRVVFVTGTVPPDLSKNYEYFIWTRITKTGSDLTLLALSISSRRNHSLRN